MMSYLIAVVPLADTPPTGSTSLFDNPLIPMVLLGVIMYLMLIRPQNLKVKQHKELLTRLKAGDRVVTSGGVYGTIAKVTDNTLDLKVADKVVITVARAAISRTCDEGEQA